MSAPKTTYLPQVVTIVSAYISKNSVRPIDLHGLIASVDATLASLSTPELAEAAAPVAAPAVPIKKSISDEALTCLVCGRSFLSLKRHLLSSHALTPSSYRDMFGLKDTYPMVAPKYSIKRAQIVRAMGLGNKGDVQA